MLFILGCGADPAAPMATAPGAAGTGTASPERTAIDSALACEDCDAPADPPPQLGTQTGEEGDNRYCGEGPPRLEPVDESASIAGRYAGFLTTADSGAVRAELTFANPGRVLAQIWDYPGCAGGRFVNIDWSLSVPGVLAISELQDVVGYRAVELSGVVSGEYAPADIAVEVPVPSARDFQSTGGATSRPDAGAAPSPDGVGPVEVSVYGEFTSSAARFHVQWECADCDPGTGGSRRTGLPFLEGTLQRVP